MSEVCEFGNVSGVKRRRRRTGSYYAVPLRRFVILLDRYNARRGTEFSYGQAVEALKNGRIDIDEFRRGR